MTTPVDSRFPTAPDNGSLISVTDARERILSVCPPLPSTQVSLIDALGMVAAESIPSLRDVPPFANSALDGFACRSVDLATATRTRPVQLHVSRTVQAGDLPGTIIGPGEAIRILTGAPLPDGANVVVPFERVKENSGSVAIFSTYPEWANTREKGEDVRRGAGIVSAGRRIRPGDIALLAACGLAEIAVHRRPKVAVLATGDELVPPGQEPRPGQIVDANTDSIAAMVRLAGGVPIVLGIARDNQVDIRERLEQEKDIDLIVTSGGVSVGDFDLVGEMLRQNASMEFWQVRIKPGRPFAFGQFRGIPLLGLPGNPVAVAVTFLQLVRPAILKMLGRTDLALPRVQATMRDPVDNSGGWVQYVRVRLSESAEGYEAHLAGFQGAAILSTLANADGLLVVPESTSHVEPGTTLPVELLGWD